MQALNRTLELIQEQFRNFSTTARLLLVAMLVIMTLSLMLVASLTGTSELVPLGLDASADADTKARVVAYLDANKIPNEPSGTDILVPATRKLSIMGSLGAGGVVGISDIDLSQLIEQERSPFEDRETSKRKYLVRKMNLVSQFVAALDDVTSASVIIDTPHRQTGIGASAVRTSATAIVTPSGGRVSRSLANAIAAMVAGAESTLGVDRVTVIDATNGQSLKATSSDDIDSGDYLRSKSATERHFEEKIRTALSYIPGLIVSVNAQINAIRERSESLTYEDPKSAAERERSREYSSTSQRPQATPGVRGNVGASIASGSGPSNAVEASSSDTKLSPRFPEKRMWLDRPAGEALRIDATVVLPKSWLLSLYQQENGAEADPPNTAALDAIAAIQEPIIKATVENLCRTDTADGAIEGTVTVATMADPGFMVGFGVPGFAGTETASGGVASFLVSDGLISTAGLLALAGVSIAFMFMMVKKASRQEEMPTAEELVGIPPALTEAESDLVGEVEESDAAMEGVEISEEEVRRHQMLDQINEMAKTSPGEAAGLLRKWIKADQV